MFFCSSRNGEEHDLRAEIPIPTLKAVLDIYGDTVFACQNDRWVWGVKTVEDCSGEELISAFEVQLNNHLLSTSVPSTFRLYITNHFAALLKHHILPSLHIFADLSSFGDCKLPKCCSVLFIFVSQRLGT